MPLGQSPLGLKLLESNVSVAADREQVENLPQMDKFGVEGQVVGEVLLPPDFFRPLTLVTL